MEMQAVRLFLLAPSLIFTATPSRPTRSSVTTMARAHSVTPGNERFDLTKREERSSLIGDALHESRLFGQECVFEPVGMNLILLGL